MTEETAPVANNPAALSPLEEAKEVARLFAARERADATGEAEAQEGLGLDGAPVDDPAAGTDGSPADGEQAKEPLQLPSSEDVRKELTRVQDLERLAKVLAGIGILALAALVVVGVLTLYNAVSGNLFVSDGTGMQQGAVNELVPGTQVEISTGGGSAAGEVIARPGDNIGLTSTGTIVVNGAIVSGSMGEYPAELAKKVSFPSQVPEGSYLVYFVGDGGTATIELVSREQIRPR